jgi:hypothetical protein
MKRGLLFCGGMVLGLVAEIILWGSPDLYGQQDTWLPEEFTRTAVLGLIVQGAVAAFGAALCLGHALGPLTSAQARDGITVLGSAPLAAGGGPVLLICGFLFLLAASGPFQQARDDSEKLEVMDSMHGYWGKDLVADFRRAERTERTFGIGWLVVGGGLLGVPLMLRPSAWQVSRRINRAGCGTAVAGLLLSATGFLVWSEVYSSIAGAFLWLMVAGLLVGTSLFVGPGVWRINRWMNGVGCGIAVGGLLLSGMGVFVWYVNGLLMEGATKDLSLVGHWAVLAGAVVTVAGSIIAVVGGSAIPLG